MAARFELLLDSIEIPIALLKLTINLSFATRGFLLGRRTRPMDMKHFQNKINHTD